MGQFAYKSDCISEQDLLGIVQHQRTGRGIQCREQHCVLKDPRVCQRILYTAFPCGSISYQCSHLQSRLLPLGTDKFPVFFHVF